MPSDRQPVRFGVFEVNLGTGEMRRAGVKVRLQEQPFQVLAALLEKPGEIVTKEELQERIWKDDTYVDFDRSLATAINKVRRALGGLRDSAAVHRDGRQAWLSVHRRADWHLQHRAIAPRRSPHSTKPSAHF